ncbi:hypothetical protein G3T36_06055 [Diaminobutyricibacter tongyongensis]|uniref:DUF7882 domain-containing protein n=1 Tax=Leifsonia tongyongensis TaxID=1268043 RepID=A0A6L9XVH1_9MICO|nr:hypothetical protein [Diaminobutyricibacter tongyongensis]NEN05430.1 hypothetical protein [Diaminobutyricibacter tongyongensis]
MGTLIYGANGRSIEFDDRDLAHLQFVIAGKLRRSENFLLTFRGQDDVLHVLWLSPAVALEFIYSCPVYPSLNRKWLEQLTISANQSGVLLLAPEPVGAAERALEFA